MDMVYRYVVERDQGSCRCRQGYVESKRFWMKKTGRLTESMDRKGRRECPTEVATSLLPLEYCGSTPEDC